MYETETFRGNRIYKKGNKYYYFDDSKEVEGTWKDKPCGRCGLTFTEEGHDPCLGHLPNVVNACCGHGRREDAYIEFTDGSIYRSSIAVRMQEELKDE